MLTIKYTLESPLSAPVVEVNGHSLEDMLTRLLESTDAVSVKIAADGSVKGYELKTSKLLHELTQFNRLSKLLLDTFLDNQIFFTKVLDNEPDSTGNQDKTSAAK